jgi:hypothetical protein
VTRRLLAPVLLAGAVALSLPAAPASAQCPIFGCILRGCWDFPDGGRICW